MGFGSRLKKAAKKVGRVADGVGDGTVSVVQEAANRAVKLPGAVADAAGLLHRKELRLRVIVLADGSGDPVLQAGGNGDSARDQVQEAVDVAREIFWSEAKIQIVPAGRQLVVVDSEPAPAEALEVRCDTGALKDDLGVDGRFFRSRMARNDIGTITGAAAPITAFIVRDVIGKQGCSLGPLSDYVTVDVSGVTSGTRRVLAHEIGHALGLPHTGGAGSVISGKSTNNLMNTPSGEKLNRRQVATVRNSRHVTVL